MSEVLADDAVESLAEMMAGRFGTTSSVRPVPRLEDLDIPPSRLRPPPSLASCFTDDRFERAAHSLGKAYRDVVRALHGRLRPPDLVALPASERDVEAILDWCSDEGVAVVPYGGGSSVVGGVEPPPTDVASACVSLDLRRLDRVVEVDPLSRSAEIEAGIYGPALEEALRAHGLTLRHYPQSFEFSTLGGWIATRSGGHYATGPTRIDEFVQAVRMITPRGAIETRRLPASGAGPDPNRLVCGSEGTLGVITKAWMRLVERPRWRAAADVHFADWEAALAACRELVQSGLRPANCRLIDREEAALQAGVSDGSHLLVLAFESAHHPVDHEMRLAADIVSAHEGVIPGGLRTTGPDSDRGGSHSQAAQRWRSSFFKAPYLRDALARCGMIVETFETACVWSAFGELHDRVTEGVTSALRRICGGGLVTCRITHLYPDGAAPYFSVIAPGRPGSELAQWDEIKAAATEIILSAGGTVTHHHAVGRDHLRFALEERPPLFHEVLAAAKQTLDPEGIMNPGVLLPPEGPPGVRGRPPDSP